MSMKFNRLLVEVETNAGPFVTDLRFSKGLNILRAENTSGKSTLINALAYGLGLEAVLGRRSKRPFTPAMYHMVKHKEIEYPVLRSSVFVEIENHDGQTFTCRRDYHGGNDKQLVLVSEGAIANRMDSEPVSYYVRLPGAAQAKHGFHRWLAEFVGWTLPQVMTFDGREVPLYIELVFTLLFVEQTNGWSAIQANLPTYFGIKNAAKRSTEFLLDLDAPDVSKEREALAHKKQELRREWRQQLTQAELAVKQFHGRFVGVSSEPVMDFETSGAGRAEVHYDEQWVPLSEAITLVERRVAELQRMAIPLVADVAPELEVRLSEVMHDLKHLERAGGRALNQYEAAEAERDLLRRRVEALQEDLKEYRDLKTLQKLGAYQKLASADGHCPTCMQALQDTLLIPSEGAAPASIDQNMKFITEQIKLFQNMLKAAEKDFIDRDSELSRIREDISRRRRQVRAIRESLTSSPNTPSVALIGDRMMAQEELDRLRAGEDLLREIRTGFYEISVQWKEVESDLKRLPKTGFSDEDDQKMDDLSALVREQARAYGFSSFDVQDIGVSKDTYRPTRDGFEIGFDASASDNIRLMWAYYLGLLELDRIHHTNHPGFLVFDEPRQQEARQVSFERLLERAAYAKKHGQQVIFATSEEPQHLRPIVEELSVQYIATKDLLLQPRW